MKGELRKLTLEYLVKEIKSPRDFIVVTEEEWADVTIIRLSQGTKELEDLEL